MNPVFIAAAIAGAQAGRNRAGYTPPTEERRYFWKVDDDRYEDRKFRYACDIGSAIGAGSLDLPDGDRMPVTEYEGRPTRPRATGLLKTAALAGATAISATFPGSWPLTAVLAGATLVQLGLAVTSPATGEAATPFKEADLFVGDHPRGDGSKTVFYQHVSGPGGDRHGPVSLLMRPFTR